MNENVVAKNSASREAVELAPLLRAVFGLPTIDYPYFDLPLCKAIFDWQRSAGLSADGDLGPKTRARLAALRYLDGDLCEALWPAPSALKREHYEGLALFAGATFSERPLLLGLRGAYPYARRTHRTIHAPRYDDAFIRLDPERGLVPVVFAGATHAYQQRSSESPDVVVDGAGDVGSIRTGLYRMKLVSSSPPQFLITLPNGDQNLPAHRDFDHDGVVSEAEALRSETLVKGRQVVAGVGTTANAVLFHPGYDTMKSAGRPFSSIACQTAPLSALKLLADTGREFDYLLVNAADVEGVKRAMRSTDPELRS